MAVMSTGRLTAIIADDERSIREGLSDMPLWKELGIDIIGLAEDGEEAVKLITSYHPDFAVMDIRMPRLSGLEALEEITRESEGTDIIILSGYDSFDYAKEALRYQAKAYLLKPVDENELRDVLSSLIAKRPEKGPGKKLTRSALNDLVQGSLIDTAGTVSLIAEKVPDSFVFVLLISFPEKQTSLEELMGRFEKALPESHVAWWMDSSTLLAILNESGISGFTLATEALAALGVEAYAATGAAVPRLQQLSYSYTRARTALSYQFYYEKASVFTSDMIPESPPKIRPGDLRLEKLQEAILSADSSLVIKESDKLIDQLAQRPYPPPGFTLSMAYSAVKTVETNLSQLLPEGKDIAAKRLSSSKTLTELREAVSSVFLALSGYISSIYGSDRAEELLQGEEDEVIRKAKEYITRHLDEQIKTEDIAEEVNLSPSYFAIYFKKKTGQNLRNYILAVKIEWAKKELSRRNSSVNDVAFALGYTDYRSFSRAFKNVTGMTPSEFMER